MPPTTFITPFGRFKFLRALFGISSISEHYNRGVDEAFAGLTGYRRIVDDIVIYDSDKAQHTDHVRQFLRRCSERKITLNTEKWLFAKTEVNFARFHLSVNPPSSPSSVFHLTPHPPQTSHRGDLIEVACVQARRGRGRCRNLTHCTLNLSFLLVLHHSSHAHVHVM